MIRLHSAVYDANGHRNQKTVTTGGSNPTTYQVNDTYQNGHLASQSTLGGTLLATFTYDPSGIPESVVVGPDPVNSPRYYYVYNGHGDVVALTDASGNVVASYSYDVWGTLTASSENIPNANGWANPYHYDGKDGARYDLETGLYWLSTRAYDPSVGRFVQRDPLGRAPLFFGDTDQPYAYAGNNPLVNTDPSGGLFWHAGGMSASEQGQAARVTRIQARRAASQCSKTCQEQQRRQRLTAMKWNAENAAKNDAKNSADLLQAVGQGLTWLTWFFGFATAALAAMTAAAVIFQPEVVPVLAMWSARLLMATAALAQLSSTVNFYHDMFAGEADHDLGWFTSAHVDDYLGSRNTVFAVMGITADGAAGISLLALVATITKWGAKAFGLALPGYVGVAINAVALVGLYAYTNAQINQQEADLCPSSLAQAHAC